MRWVVCAAIKDVDTGTIYCGPRHVHCFEAIQRSGIEKFVPGRFQQGFVDQDNNFMTRQEAYTLAEENNQIRFPDPGKGNLFSENLY